MKKILILLLCFINIQGLSIKPLTGKATYYADKFVGRKTANGEIFSQNKLTGASNFFKLGTFVEITNLENCKVVTVKINDRTAVSTARRGVVVDLSRKAMNVISHKGIAKVEIKKIGHVNKI